MSNDLITFPEAEDEPRDSESAASETGSDPPLRYVVIEYKPSCASADLSKADAAGRTGRFEEIGFRSGTKVAGFGHANLVLVRDSDDDDDDDDDDAGAGAVPTGVRWSIGKDRRGAVTVKKAVSWHFLPSSRFVLQGFTYLDDEEINVVVDEYVARNGIYKLFEGNCEGFCLGVSERITERDMDGSIADEYHEFLNQAFRNSMAAGIQYQRDYGPNGPPSWTHSAVVGVNVFVVSVAYWIFMGLFMVIVWRMLFPDRNDSVQTVAAIVVVVLTVHSVLLCAFTRSTWLHDRDTSRMALPPEEREDRRLWYGSIFALVMYMMLFGALSFGVESLVYGDSPKGLRILTIFLLSLFSVFVVAWGIFWWLWKSRRLVYVDIDEDEEVEGV